MLMLSKVFVCMVRCMNVNLFANVAVLGVVSMDILVCWRLYMSVNVFVCRRLNMLGHMGAPIVA